MKSWSDYKEDYTYIAHELFFPSSMYSSRSTFFQKHAQRKRNLNRLGFTLCQRRHKQPRRAVVQHRRAAVYLI